MQEVYVGVDVSKARLDVFSSKTGHFKVGNDVGGWKKLFGRLGQGPELRLIVEATGGYEEGVLHAACDAEVHVAQINPRHHRAFAKAMGRTAKTDRIDAETLARFGEAIRPRRYEMPSEALRNLRVLVTRRRQLVSARASERCIAKQSSGVILADVEAHIVQLSDRIGAIETLISRRVDTCEELKERTKRLRTIPSVGRVTAVVLVAALPELGTVCRRQIAALAGLAPLNNDSGQHRGRRSCWGGRADVRKALFMASLTALKNNPPIKALFERMKARGKPGKVAIVACMRKLLTMANSMERTKSDFQLAP